MRSLAEVTWTDYDRAEPMTVTEQVWVLHFGVKSEVVDAGEGRLIGVSNTVAVCEDVKTGQLNCFPPEQIRILGTEIKK